MRMVAREKGVMIVRMAIRSEEGFSHLQQSKEKDTQNCVQTKKYIMLTQLQNSQHWYKLF